jgi:hypothetical protein
MPKLPSRRHRYRQPARIGKDEAVASVRRPRIGAFAGWENVLEHCRADDYAAWRIPEIAYELIDVAVGDRPALHEASDDGLLGAMIVRLARVQI